MKKTLIGAAFLALVITSYSQEQAFRLQNQADQTIGVNETFILPIQLEPFKDANTISGLVISGNVILNSDSSLVRVLLIDDNYNEYLVFESYTLLTDSLSFSIDQIGEETTLLNNVIPSMIFIDVIDASFHLKEIITSKAVTALKPDRSNLQLEQSNYKINKINQNLKNRNIPWIAGETSISQMTYGEKKAYFGDDLPNLYGFEYYTGGIFVMPGALDEETDFDYNSVTTDLGDSPYVKEFSWRDVHGQDWVTPVKNQHQCGSCWAFAATGATELLVNLYFNQQLDLNLSEQHLLSCSGSGSCNGGWTYKAVNYIRTSGIVEEDCFPYVASDVECANICQNPAEKITIGGFKNYLERTVDNFKKIVLNGASTISILPWRHSITLVGYKTLNAGDKVYIRSSVENRWVTIDNNSSLIGKTAWLIKNSWGTYWGDGGFAYVVTNMSDIYEYDPCQLLGPVTSLNYNTTDIECTDNDNDGYFTWGIGPKPAHCPTCPAEPDGDDSNGCIGPRDAFGNLQSLTTPEPTTEDVTIFEGQLVPDLNTIGSNILWYSDYDLNNLVHTGNSFATGHTSPGIYTYYVTQTLSDCESVPKAVYLTILEGITPPVTNDVEVCFGDQRLMKAIGESIRWYSDPALNVLVHEGNTYSPPVTEPAIYTYYLTQTIEDLESPPAHVKYTIKQAPGPYIADDVEFCNEEGLYMYASGDNIKWYTKEFSNEVLDVRDNRIYATINIGNQVWMAENLDVGTQISGSQESSDNNIIEKYYYNDDPELGQVLGGLYQWDEMMQYSIEIGAQGICPAGWHVPSHDEWKELEVAIGMSKDEVDLWGNRGTDQGTQLKSGGSSGFEALMGGKRTPEGTFGYLEYFTTFWNSNVFNRTLSEHYEQVYAGSSSVKANGFSVRCVMDDSSFVRYGNELDISHLDPGNYTFRVTNTFDGCESTPDTVSLTLRATPPPPVVADYEYCIGKELPLMQTSGENIKWYHEFTDDNFVDVRDNREYDIVHLGHQVWMTENLDIGTQIDGSMESTNNGFIEKYYYNDDPALGNVLGGLYQWDEMMNYSIEIGAQDICPEGWKVPSNKDWMKLEMELGMNQSDAASFRKRGTDQGLQLKENGSSGFEALMGGKRTPEGTFGYVDSYTTFWNSDAYNRTLSTLYEQVLAGRSSVKANGFSVRCIMHDSAYTSMGNVMVPPQTLPGIYTFEVTETVAGCESESAIINLTLRDKPISPLSRTINYCEGEDITSINVGGENIKWYADIDLDTLLHEGNAYKPMSLTLGINTFYVTQSSSYCESDPGLISIELKPLSERPNVPDVSCCFGDIVPSLMAEGEGILWYGDVNLVEEMHTGAEFATGKSNTGIYTFYATQSVNGCESLPDTVTLTINQIPTAPHTSKLIICEGDLVPELLVIGEEVRWYNDSVLSQLLHLGSVFAPTQVDAGYYPYYVTNTINGCASTTVLSSLTIKEKPIAPISSDVSVCKGDTIPNVLAFGDSIKWYNDIGLVNLILSGSNLQIDTDIPGIYTYYATQTKEGCESPPQEVGIRIKELPLAPIATDVQICEGDETFSLSAAGDNIKWYDNVTMENPIHFGNHLDTVPLKPGTYLFYATQTQEECEGMPEEVELLLNELPIISLGKDTAIQENEELIIGPFPIEFSYLWSTTTTDPFLKIIGNDIEVGGHEISIQVSYNGCIFKDTIIVTIENTIGIGDLITKDGFKVYPNPTQRDITVEFLEDVSDDAVIEIFDSKGSLIKKSQIKNMKLESNVSFKIYLETTGLFYLRIYNNDQIYNCKVIRQ